MDFDLTHTTHFEYEGAVHESVMELRLEPRADAGQSLLSWTLRTDPTATLFRYLDSLGNPVHHFDIGPAHQSLLVEAQSRVRTSPAPGLPPALDASTWATIDARRDAGQLWDFFEPSPRVPVTDAVRAFASSADLTRARDPLTCLRQIASAVFGAFTYAPGETTVDTPVDAALAARRGVCQDFAHLALAVGRSIGLPCRYVSGYLAPPDALQDAPHLMTHAWIEAWLPGLDWVAIDPTHDLLAGERHIRVAVGRDYSDAAPTRGVFRGGPAGPLTVSVRIGRDDRTPVTGSLRFPPTMPTAASTGPPRPDQ